MSSPTASSRVLLLFVCWGVVASATAAPPLVRLPDQFFVTTGTTIPFTFMEPVAQTGSMYVDSTHRRFRVDTFWMDMSRSIVVDLEKGHCVILQGQSCKTMKLRADDSRRDESGTGFGVPHGFVRHAETFAVRGVSVQKYSGVERSDYLQQVDYYVRNMTFTDPRIVPEHSGDVIPPRTVPILWRIETKRSHRKELAAAPPEYVPNWRFFGQPLNELVALDDTHSSAVEQIVADVPITIDFFNFVPMQPDPNVFAVPAICDALPEEMDRDVDVFAAQRLLVDLSFHSAHGRRVMEMLWGNKATPPATAPSSDTSDL